LLRALHPNGRMIVVFGSAGERDVAKRPQQGEVAARLADISVVTSEDPRLEDAEAIIEQIAAGARTAGAREGTSLFLRTDRREAMRLAFDLAEAGDCVLLAGKGHEGSIIWGREKIPWDEAAVARDLLLGTDLKQPAL
ncbi:MAG TPA: cyanophycin synthetase, partial [Fimbriimonadaceae bacterium]|nr:cyanophycin synthetase [Fimbriimonadaceae bacterium]